MNPNYKESLPREWWQTSFQILPPDEIMAKIKANDPKFTVLDGSCRQMQGSRIEMIAQQCTNNTSITEIDLRANGFDSDGLYALVQALKTMPNVKKLNLRNNTCRNEGVEALGEFLKVRAARKFFLGSGACQAPCQSFAPGRLLPLSSAFLACVHQSPLAYPFGLHPPHP